MEKITAMVRYYYDQEITVEVEDPEDEQAIYEKVEQLADNIKVWDGNNSWTVNFSDYEIEL